MALAVDFLDFVVIRPPETQNPWALIAQGPVLPFLIAGSKTFIHFSMKRRGMASEIYAQTRRQIDETGASRRLHAGMGQWTHGCLRARGADPRGRAQRRRLQ